MCIVSMAFMSASQKLVFAVALLAYIDHVRSLTSANGCTCTSDCAPSFDDSRPWCYTANSCGSYAYSRASYYDYCTPPSPPPPSQVDGNRYHRCYLTSDCGGQCNSWAQCTYNPYGASCTASPFAYACDLQTTTCSSDKTGYFGYCPPGTVLIPLGYVRTPRSHTDVCRHCFHQLRLGRVRPSPPPPAATGGSRALLPWWLRTRAGRASRTTPTSLQTTARLLSQ